MPISEKAQAPLVQAHAFDHYLHGTCTGEFPIANARSNLRCPMCLRWLSRAQFSLEHAPQWSKQSRLGPAWMVLSCCAECNSKTAGQTFEREAAVVARADARRNPDRVRCGIHGTKSADTGFEIGWMVGHAPVTLADIKSAYLIAFAVLGYSWVTSSRLESVRFGFRSSSLAAEDDVFATCGLLGSEHERTVVEVCSPFSAVLVVGPKADVVIAFATDGTRGSVRRSFELVQGRRLTGRQFDWPLMVRETQRQLELDSIEKPETAWDDGHTFHLDRCDQPHAGTVVGSRASTRAINARLSQPTTRPQQRPPVASPETDR